MKRIFSTAQSFVILIGISALVTGQSAANENTANSKLATTYTVKSTPINRTLDVSRKIDELVRKGLDERKLKPNGPVSDEVFVRRVYLDIIGRIPSYAETVKFLKDESTHKRQHLIDQLLDSKGFESHQFNYFADLLRVKTRIRNVTGQPYVDFVKDSIRENKPYDKFVREMVTASGNYAERGNGAVGYYLRDFGMPEDNMSNTIRVFLGTRLECAQCHDHPFDVWTQKDYFEMVAFTGGILMRVQPPFGNANEIRQMQRSKDISENARRNLQRILRPLSYGVQGSGTGLARLPKDYQESDGEPNQIISAKTMFDKKELVVPQMPKVGNKNNRRFRNSRNRTTIPGAKHIDSREAYADWLTSAENPRFATVIANRMWKRAMGVGLIEPVDIITDETDPSNPELMEYLTNQMVEMKFDLKQFLRAVYNSETYQQSACVSDDEEITKYSFRGPLLRRLSGEQLWDSLMTLAVDKIDEREAVSFNRQYQGMDIYTIYEKTKEMSVEEIMELANMSRDEIRKKQRAEYDKAAAKQKKLRTQQYKAYKELQKRQMEARKNKDYKALAQIKKEYKELAQKSRKQNSRAARDLVRASEMVSPAQPGHLVRDFGQSDRDTIENSNKEPAVTQVLSLMNGFIENRIAANPNTHLMVNLDKSEKPEQKINTVFLSILNRYPTAKEKKIWLEEAKTNQKTVAADLIWTLVNNSEFLFIQ